MRATNQNKFLELRKDYPFFSYEDFKIQFINNELCITYFFNLSDKYFFKPSIKIPLISHFKYENLSEAKLKNIVFQIGMVELISYWKATCSPKVFINPFLLEDKQISFWEKVYYNGLGEFFYINSIDTNKKSFMEIECKAIYKATKTHFTLQDTNIIPIGGGKDSIITLELLRNEFKYNLCLIVNPRKASIDSAEKAGFNDENIIKVFRTIDPKLLELNDKGFLNGHTPFSALLAFVSILTAALAGIKNIALSNESSANEATVEGSVINHQYSKSFEFESDFRSYVDEFISEEFNYFSFLRPLNELMIARLFSSYPNHFMSFRSCNVGSKTDTWCCKCPKCLFTFIVLSPFLQINELVDIFGQNIFEDNEMLFYFNQLIGNESAKPFECVGTVEEVNSALCLTINKYFLKNDNLPFLLKYYKTIDNYQRFKDVNEKKLLNQFNHEHFLSKRYESILKKQF